MRRVFLILLEGFNWENPYLLSSVFHKDDLQSLHTPTLHQLGVYMSGIAAQGVYSSSAMPENKRWLGHWGLVVDPSQAWNVLHPAATECKAKNLAGYIECIAGHMISTSGNTSLWEQCQAQNIRLETASCQELSLPKVTHPHTILAADIAVLKACIAIWLKHSVLTPAMYLAHDICFSRLNSTATALSLLYALEETWATWLSLCQQEDLLICLGLPVLNQPQRPWRLPIWFYQKHHAPDFIGQCESLADIGQTIAAWLNLPALEWGIRFL